MEEVTLVAEVGRRVGKSGARAARRAGRVPAIVYGLGAEPVAVSVPGRELGNILAGPAGANTLINLDLAGAEKDLVLARQIVRHPVRHSLVHVDLIRVRRDQAVHAEVPVHLVGESVGVRDGGLLEQSVFTLSIEAKPADVPALIEADVTGLGIGDQLLVSDLTLPRGVVTTQDGGDLVVHVSAPRGVGLPEEGAAGAEAAGEAGGADASSGGGAAG